MLRRVVVEQPEELEVIARARGGAPPNAQPPIVACLPSRVRDRLIGLAHIMAAGTDPIRLKIVTAIFIIGAVAGLIPALRAARLSPTQALWSV